MTARRRPLTRDDLGVEQTLKRGVNVAPEIELGWSLLRQAMRDAGWPSRTPEGDRRERGAGRRDTEQGEPPSGIDYADPTGEMALVFDSLVADLEALQDHRHLVATSLQAMYRIARKHIPATEGAAAPACSVLTCDGTVERSPSGAGYRGMEQIAGLWVARAGERPVCVRHRKHFERVPRDCS